MGEDRTEGKFDVAKGRVKESAGDLTGNESLEAEGEKDQAKGHAKQAKDAVGDAVDEVKEVFDR